VVLIVLGRGGHGPGRHTGDVGGDGPSTGARP
jgi:hypothetical protein